MRWLGAPKNWRGTRGAGALQSARGSGRKQWWLRLHGLLQARGSPRCPRVSLAQQGTGSLASPLSLLFGFLSFLSTEFGLTHTTDSIDNCPLQGDLTEPGTHSLKRGVGGKDNSHVTSTMEAPTPPKNILTLSSLTAFSLLTLGFKMMFFDPGKCGQGPVYPAPWYRLYSVQVWIGLGPSVILS